MPLFHAFSGLEEYLRYNMKLLSKIVALAIAIAVPVAWAADALTMADFAYTNKLMVAGYTGTETLVNFPVLVRLSETRIPGFLYANLTNSKGADIAFFDVHGNHLASEIETNSWKVGTAKDSQIWVRLPHMTHSTKFFMCYNTSASGAWVTNENPWGSACTSSCWTCPSSRRRPASPPWTWPSP